MIITETISFLCKAKAYITFDTARRRVLTCDWHILQRFLVEIISGTCPIVAKRISLMGSLNLGLRFQGKLKCFQLFFGISIC